MTDPLAPHFDIVRPLGGGGFGIVHLVKRKNDNALFAVKTFKGSPHRNSDLDQMVDREIDLVRTLDHPNIVSFECLLQRGTTRYLVMEYCAGGDLHKLLERYRAANGTFPISRAQQIFCEALLALHHCHHSHAGQGTLLHRDLKPENVLFSKTGVVKLADFGLARAMQHGTNSTRTFVGTPGYMPPEILSGKAYDHKADIYSLGVLLFEMFTLRIPDPRLRGLERASNLLLPGGFDGDHQSLVSTLLAYEPTKRPSTADLLYFPLIARWLQECLKRGDDQRSPDQTVAERNETPEAAHADRVEELQTRAERLDRQRKALRDKQKSLEAREATLEARIRRLNARLSASPEPPTRIPSLPPLSPRAQRPLARQAGQAKTGAEK